MKQIAILTHFAISVTLATTIACEFSCKKAAPDEPFQGTFVDRIAFVRNSGQAVPVAVAGDLVLSGSKYVIANTVDLCDHAVGPQISFNRSQITLNRAYNTLHPMIANADGSNLHEVIFDTTVNCQWINLSPDLKSVVIYFGYFNGRLSLGTASATGGHLREIYAEPEWSLCPCWSPDGKKIYFQWDDGYNRFGFADGILTKAYIASIAPDGTDLRFVSDTLTANSDDYSPEPSPNGERIAFTSMRNHHGHFFPEVFIMDTTGKNVRQLSTAIVGTFHGSYYDYYTEDESPHWLKDNEHIIYERQTFTYNGQPSTYDYSVDLYIVRCDGTELQKLTDNGSMSLLKHQ